MKPILYSYFLNFYLMSSLCSRILYSIPHWIYYSDILSFFLGSDSFSDFPSFFDELDNLRGINEITSRRYQNLGLSMFFSWLAWTKFIEIKYHVHNIISRVASTNMVVDVDINLHHLAEVVRHIFRL